MGSDVLKIISANIAKIVKNTNLTNLKDLSDKAHISYTTLVPILKGERDFRISNLIAIAEALECTPNDLMEGLFTDKKTDIIKISKETEPKYLISFITNVSMSHCQVYDVKNKTTEMKMFPFSLACTDNVADTLGKIKNAIIDMCGEQVLLSEIHLYISVVGYEHIIGRNKLQFYGSKEFKKFTIESDWTCTHRAVIAKKNGILIIINDGYVITISNDHGKTLNKLQGYSFPLDDAGNFWLGFEAIKHAINVAEGVEKRSLLSNKILSLVNSDLNLLATRIYDQPREVYVETAKIVKELAYKKDKAFSIIKKGFDNIWKRIKQIDTQLTEELLIYLAGDLAYLYENFIPTKRLARVSQQNITDLQLEYALQLLLSSL